MERSSTAMQITGIGNSSLGLIIALKISPFSPTHPTLGVALKKEIGEIFFSSFGLSQGTGRPPPVTLGETPKKQLAEMRRGHRGVCDLAQRARADPEKDIVNLFFFGWFGM